MFVHSVHFWLKPDLSDDDKRQFLDGARSLLTCPTVKKGFLGVPADTDRPIIERSHSYTLIAAFDDKAGHDAYQVHPIHDKFREECEKCWNRVLIFDSVDDGV
ncbi:MAG: Dabb family protein [Phycisphaera sp.]|nr:Dabb family protein [Phycisphaera sp.]